MTDLPCPPTPVTRAAPTALERRRAQLHLLRAALAATFPGTGCTAGLDPDWTVRVCWADGPPAVAVQAVAAAAGVGDAVAQRRLSPAVFAALVLRAELASPDAPGEALRARVRRQVTGLDLTGADPDLGGDERTVGVLLADSAALVRPVEVCALGWDPLWQVARFLRRAGGAAHWSAVAAQVLADPRPGRS